MRYPAGMNLDVTDLACARGGIPVLEGVSFSVPAGSLLILRGPNGIGKTTLLRTLAGLQPPLSGRIEAPPDTVAYGAHADGLKATLTVTENLAFWARLHGTGTIAPALAALGLESLRDRPAQNLSAGQRRRLGLARMLVTGRPIWLLDEPTVSLDADGVALFGEAVRRHLSHGGIALIATHVDLGLGPAPVLDLSAHRAAEPQDGFDETFGELP